MIPGMDISLPCVVTLTWTLADAQGKLIDELAEPLEFLVGGQDLLPKVEEVLIGHPDVVEAASLAHDLGHIHSICVGADFVFGLDGDREIAAAVGDAIFDDAVQGALIERPPAEADVIVDARLEARRQPGELRHEAVGQIDGGCRAIEGAATGAR